MKLSAKEASHYIFNAVQEVALYNELRFGQALWNSLPKEVTDPAIATDSDFFYWKDERKVLETFLCCFVNLK